MTPATVLVSKPAKRANAVVLVDDDVAGAQLRERSQGPPAPDPNRTLGRAPPAEQPVLGDHGEVELRRDEALPQSRVREQQARGRLRCWSRGPAAGPAVVQPADLQPAEVVRGALALPAHRRT